MAKGTGCGEQDPRSGRASTLLVILVLYLGLGVWLLVASWLQAQLRGTPPPPSFPPAPRCFVLTLRVVTWPGILAAIRQEHPEARIENQRPASPRVETREGIGPQIWNEGAVEADVVGVQKWLRNYEATTHRAGQKVQLVGRTYELTGLVVKREPCPSGARGQQGRR